ncbi:MAG: hypothetical protein AAGI68_12765, partial [Planctomycetota bacterium]
MNDGVFWPLVLSGLFLILGVLSGVMRAWSLRVSGWGWRWSLSVAGVRVALGAVLAALVWAGIGNGPVGGAWGEGDAAGGPEG